jgi:hypothetical protein
MRRQRVRLRSSLSLGWRVGGKHKQMSVTALYMCTRWLGDSSARVESVLLKHASSGAIVAFDTSAPAEYRNSVCIVFEGNSKWAFDGTEKIRARKWRELTVALDVCYAMGPDECASMLRCKMIAPYSRFGADKLGGRSVESIAQLWLGKTGALLVASKNVVTTPPNACYSIPAAKYADFEALQDFLTRIQNQSGCNMLALIAKKRLVVWGQDERVQRALLNDGLVQLDEKPLENKMEYFRHDVTLPYGQDASNLKQLHKDRMAVLNELRGKLESRKQDFSRGITSGPRNMAVNRKPRF